MERPAGAPHAGHFVALHAYCSCFSLSATVRPNPSLILLRLLPTKLLSDSLSASSVNPRHNLPGAHSVQTFTKSAAELVAAAEAEITAFAPADVQQRMTGDNPPVLIDIRDVRELSASGRISGAVHAPRGMLEFWADPESPYHRDVFSTHDSFVLFCAAGWRSALATKTLQDMGMTGLAHMAGGFTAWVESGLPVDKDTSTR